MSKCSKKCECGKRFYPYAKCQRRCIYCILEAKPKKPTNETSGYITPEFSEWFIYQWYHVRRIAAEKLGVPFEFDDGILLIEEEKHRAKTGIDSLGNAETA